MKIDRRNFVQLAAGGALGATASGFGVQEISRIKAVLDAEDVRVPGGTETWSPSLCSLCPAGCGLRVRSIGKRVVKIQGNPLHPVNSGGLCPKGLAALQELYHPDRLRRPLRNTGSRKSPRWSEVSWEEAVATLAGRLRELRDGGKGQSVVMIGRDEHALSSRLFRRFLEAYGSPNYFVMPSGLDAFATAIYWQQGISRPVAFDWENTRYVLSFGVNLLEGWGSPANVMRAFGRWRDSSAGRRTKLVQVEPRFSFTAARADEWVSLRPGTEATLALGIAGALIAEGLYDADFVREHTFGFDDWRDAAGQPHIGFRSLVLNEYRLEDVAAMTGVPPETILRLAREIAQNRPALALGDHQTSTLPGNPFAAMAVHSLNALTGSIDTPGGVLFRAEAPLGPGSPRREARPFPSACVTRLPRAEALLLDQVDPLFALPDGGAFRRALEDAPFAAAFTTFWNETAALCDLVLPAPTALEQWQAMTSPPGIPYPLFSLAPPVIPPRHRTRAPADLLLEVARRLRGSVAAALPFATFEEYLRTQTNEVFAAQTGSIFSAGLEQSWDRLLERSGLWAPTWSKPDELWEQMKEHGGWWEPSYSHGQWDRVFQTPSRRFEFYPQTLAAWAARRPEEARAAGLRAGTDRDFLPHQPPLLKAPAGRPLLLAPFEILPMAGGSGAHLPYLQQIAGPHLSEAWESWAEIHPETAARLGIKDGDLVWIESSRGRARVRARCYPGAHPDTVSIPLGYGHAAGSEWSRRGVNPVHLLEEHAEQVTGLPQAWSTHVKIYKS